MTKLHKALLAATALIAVAGCAKKRPAQLPPPPLTDTGTTDAGVGTGAQDGSGTGAIVPGSDADFRRSVSSNTVNFQVDAYDIDATARAILDSQAEWLARNPTRRITLEGHADERGTREYNLALGDRRANAAKNYLAARGVDAGRMTTISYGKERPVAPGSDEESYAQNRRAVTIVLN
jgi:peptidoglycan-associated lipoprotein